MVRAAGVPRVRGTAAVWQRDADVTAHLLITGEQPVAYGELWFDAEEDEVELARITVAPEARGRGLGRTLVRGLLDKARDSGHADVFMRVHPDNDTALRCYRGVGFVPVAPESAEAWNAAQPVDYVWLRHGRP